MTRNDLSGKKILCSNLQSRKLYQKLLRLPRTTMTFVLGTGIRMEVCVRNLVVRGFH